jgi:tellurite resistance protein TerC
MGYRLISIWFWILYHLVIAIFIGIDLWAGIRRKHEMTYKEAGKWVVVWITIGVLFGIIILFLEGYEAAGLYYAAYAVEKALSLDNLFVFAIIFSYFAVPLAAQPVVLYVGILSAVFLRAVFIFGGLWLIEEYYWMVFIFGAVLLITGIRLLRGRGEQVDPGNNPIVKLTRKVLPIADWYDGMKFIVRSRSGGKLLFTPLILTLIAIETTDVIFAFDSVPAVIAITESFFIAYTSNISAILGLRSLYFFIAITTFKFKYVGKGLAVILIFLGTKLFLGGLGIVEIPTFPSLIVVFTILGVSILLSKIIKDKIQESKNPSTIGGF